jgi:hypothetical protein
LLIFASKTGGNKPIAGLQLSGKGAAKVFAHFRIHVANAQLAQAFNEVRITLAKAGGALAWVRAYTSMFEIQEDMTT